MIATVLLVFLMSSIATDSFLIPHLEEPVHLQPVRRSPRCIFDCTWKQFCDPGSNQCEHCEEVCGRSDEDNTRICNRFCQEYLDAIDENL